VIGRDTSRAEAERQLDAMAVISAKFAGVGQLHLERWCPMRLLIALVLINLLIWTGLSITGPVSSILYAQRTQIFPEVPAAQGQWATIRSGHILIGMVDGRVLDWIPQDGSWRLWNYDPTHTGDVLPDPPVAYGQWRTLRSGHTLIPMRDGRVLDWVAADGSWRLWNYDPGSTEDILPDPMVAREQWATISRGQTLIPMGDGRVLDWVPNDGTWKLWEYTP